jgi:hypothetical protein
LILVINQRKGRVMNIFNKIVVVILLLFLAVVSIVSIVNIFVDLYQISDVATRVVNYFNRTNQFVLALILFLVLVVSLAILVFEFYRRKVRAASISSDQSGKTMITLKTVSNQIREKLSAMENVIDPRVNIVARNEGIIINIFSRLVRGDNVAARTQEIRTTASDFASSKLGFRVIKTNYTATGFIEPKRPVREEPEEIKPEEPYTEPGEDSEQKDS